LGRAVHATDPLSIERALFKNFCTAAICRDLSCVLLRRQIRYDGSQLKISGGLAGSIRALAVLPK
jgi:hypothetical protein